jgi:hypothetical protein
VTASGGGELADDLAGLGPTSQAAVVLSLLGGLTPAELSRVLGVPTGRVLELFTEGVERLGRTDPARHDHRELARQLGRLAGPVDPAATARAGIGDLSRGRRLAQRQRRRRGLVAATAAAAAALVVAGGVRSTGQGEVAQVPASPTPAASSTSAWQGYRCDTADPRCQGQRLMRWRSRTSDVMVQHLDPRRQYFSYMSWEIEPSERSASFWRGEGGALGVGLSRFGDGGTEVYLQIATDLEYADKCGKRTKQRCEVFQSMDGNEYLVGGTSTSSGGVEVQFVAAEDRVITVVARDTSAGKKLVIDSGDLIELVGDSRLRLPRR